MGRIYIGIDLAAKENRCSGFAYIACEDVCRVAEVYCLHGDSDILDAVARLLRDDRNLYVSIDAPFSLGSGMRKVDRKMISLGFRVFPPGFSYMEMLTVRAMKIVSSLKSLGVTNIYETHPRSSMLSSGCGGVAEVLDRLNVVFTDRVDRLGRDQIDAIVCAAVAYCIDRGCCMKIEDVDGIIWLLNRVCV